MLEEPLKTLPARFETKPQELTTDFFVVFANHSFGKAKIMEFDSGGKRNLNDLKIAVESWRKSLSIYAKYADKIVVARMSAKDLSIETVGNLTYCRKFLGNN